MKQLTVNRKLLPLKAHFFFSAAGMSPVVPFLPTIAKQLGFSTVVVGIVYTILPFIALLMKPLSGIISDKFQMHKTLFLSFQVLGIVSLLGINFIEPLQHTADLSLHTGTSELRYCPGGDKLLDTCAYNEIMALQPVTNHTIMSCLLNCRSNSSEHTQQFCGIQSDDPNDCVFYVRASVNLTRLSYAANCLHLPLHETTTVGGKPLPLSMGDGGAAESRCEAQCSDRNIMYQITDNKISDATVTQLTQFWAFFVCMVVSWTAMTVVGNLADTICFQILGDEPHLYGKQRLWAAVGWGIFSLIAGFMVDGMSQGQAVKNYTGVFGMMVVLLACDVLFSSRLENIHTTRSSRMMQDIGSLLRSPSICVFLTVCVAVGIGTALIWNFLFWHLEELADANASHCLAAKQWMKTLQGLAMGVQCFGGELPFFFYSGALLQRIGHTHAMSLVLLTMSVRFLLYSVLSNPWWVLPIELCQGVTYGIFYSTMASYASKVAPPGMASTVQGLVGALHEGIGIASGSLIGGVLMAKMGGSLTFRWYGSVGLALCALHVLAQFAIERFDTSRLDGKTEATDDGTDGGGVERDAEIAEKANAGEVYRSIPVNNCDNGGIPK